MDFLRKAWRLWNRLPRTVQYLAVSSGLCYVRARHPGAIPDDITPNEILGGGVAAAVLHHFEDRMKPRDPAKPAEQPKPSEGDAP